MTTSFLTLLLVATPYLASAYPSYTLQPTPTPTPTICPTTCPTLTSTVHPGYHCPTDTPYSTLECPIAKCLSDLVSTTIVTSILPCSTTSGCTVPQSCGGVTSTVIATPTDCPGDCAELCPVSVVTESRLLGGGCLRTA